jgi:hypothetical protein
MVMQNEIEGRKSRPITLMGMKEGRLYRTSSIGEGGMF